MLPLQKRNADSIVSRSKNHVTGVVHATLKTKSGPMKLYDKLCGGTTGLFWLKAGSEKITCMKCLSMLPKEINNGF
jgi:hypothetical protein